MKVLFTMGGIPHYLSPLFNKLVKKGVEVFVLIPLDQQKTIFGKGVKLTEDIGSYSTHYSVHKKKWYGKFALVDLESKIREIKPDILVLGWPYMLQYAFIPSLRSLIKEQDIKLIVREIPFQTPPYRDLKWFKEFPVYDEDMNLLSGRRLFNIKMLFLMEIRKYIYNKVNATINYASHAFAILPSYGVKKSSIFVSYNSPDTDMIFKVREEVIKLARKDIDKQRFVHVGRLVKWKKVDLLISAFSFVIKSYPNAELLIIGNGPEKEFLESQVQELNLETNVSFLGAIYDPIELGKILYESTVYVLAGMGGLSINEAMCYNLPVICSTCDGTERDLIYNGENGFFFRNGDLSDLVQKMEKMLVNPQNTKLMGDKSFNIIQEKVNINTVSQRFIDCFNFVLRR